MDWINRLFKKSKTQPPKFRIGGEVYVVWYYKFGPSSGNAPQLRREVVSLNKNIHTDLWDYGIEIGDSGKIFRDLATAEILFFEYNKDWQRRVKEEDERHKERIAKRKTRRTND